MTGSFRWDLSKREQLGRLVRGEPASWYGGFFEDLRACSARVLGLAGDSTLVFVGRSPESLFDYLSGTLAETSWRERLVLLNVSLRGRTAAEVHGSDPRALEALQDHMRGLGLDPAGVAAAPRTVALLDLVSTGATLWNVAELLDFWAERSNVDRKAVRRRLRFVGLTWRVRTSPKTWRWFQKTRWKRAYSPSVLKSVSVPGRLWHYLGEQQSKVAGWHPPHRWADEEAGRPSRDPRRLEALRLALRVYERGLEKEERRRFARLLARQPAMRHRWFRKLLLEVKGG